jgi:hypothetical protein
VNERQRDQALTAAHDLMIEARDMERRTETAVARAVHWGATWRQVADALEVTPQAAHKRYRRLRYDPSSRTAWHEPPLPI